MTFHFFQFFRKQHWLPGQWMPNVPTIAITIREEENRYWPRYLREPSGLYNLHGRFKVARSSACTWTEARNCRFLQPISRWRRYSIDPHFLVQWGRCCREAGIPGISHFSIIFVCSIRRQKHNCVMKSLSAWIVITWGSTLAGPDTRSLELGGTPARISGPGRKIAERPQSSTVLVSLLLLISSL